MTRIYYLLILLTLCCQTPATWAADSAYPDENIHINADRMNQSMTDGVYTAEGNVVVLWKGMNLAADKIRYEAATHMLYATGSIVMTKESNTLKGNTLTLNLDTDRAEIDSARLTSPETGMNITAEKLIRINESEFKATSTEMTTCDIPDPSWKFGADKLNVNLLGYATGRNVIFYVKDIPVLYLPWIAFPVVLEKRSGLLFPQVGYSKSRGMQLDLPFYWVISPSQDLQFDLDLLSKRGIGTGIDYRYIRKRGSEGHIGAYSIYDRFDDRWRWQLNQEHKEILSRDANLRMAVNANSDRSFLSDFGEKSGEYNSQSSETIVNVLKTWQNYTVNSYLRYSEDLYAADNRSTLQTLPAISMSGVRQQFFSLPLYFDVDATAENQYRETGTTGQRLHVFPRLTLLPDTGNYLNVSLFTGAHVRGYATDRRSSSSGTQASDGDVLPEAGVRLSTSLMRIYDTNFQLLKKIRHEIVPEISYNFVPKHDQERLPLYDHVDRFIHRNMISLSVTSLINGKFISGDTTEYRDISRIKLSTDYAIEGGRRDLLTLVESQRSWSDLTLESDTWLTKLLRLTFDSRYNLYDNNLSTAVVGVEVNDRQGNLIGAGYQMSRNEVEYFEGRVLTRMIKPLNLSYTGRYSFDRGDFLESVYAAEYRHKCWSVNFAVHQRPGNQSYTVNFNLAGLGSK